jgi:hypothetical protein
MSSLDLFVPAERFHKRPAMTGVTALVLGLAVSGCAPSAGPESTRPVSHIDSVSVSASASPSAKAVPTPEDEARVLAKKACRNFNVATHDPGGSTHEDLDARDNLLLTRAIALIGGASGADSRWITLETDMKIYRDKGQEWEHWIKVNGLANQEALDLLTASTTGSRAANKTCVRLVPELDAY